MKSEEMFHYRSCGLDNVWLSNGVTIRQTPVGETFHIDHIQELHEAIGLNLVNQDARLSPAEFRFLRSEMGLSRKNLADILDLSAETLKKWETGENPIQKASDVCLRNIYLDHIHHAHIRDLITKVNNMERTERKIGLSKTSQGWKDCG